MAGQQIALADIQELLTAVDLHLEQEAQRRELDIALLKGLDTHTGRASPVPGALTTRAWKSTLDLLRGG